MILFIVIFLLLINIILFKYFILFFNILPFRLQWNWNSEGGQDFFNYWQLLWSNLCFSRVTNTGDSRGSRGSPCSLWWLWGHWCFAEQHSWKGTASPAAPAWGNVRHCRFPSPAGAAGIYFSVLCKGKMLSHHQLVTG